MAHGKLGGSSGRDTLRTAAAKESVEATTREENTITLEASEDRYIRAVFVQLAADAGVDGIVHAEVSTSATALLTAASTPVIDETGSGVLAYTFSRADSTSGWAQNAGDNLFEIDFDRMQGNVEWEEGEEISVHAHNGTGNAEAVRVIVYYERVSDC